MSILVQRNILYVGWGNSSLICQSILSCFEWKQKKNKIKAVEKFSAAMLRCVFEGFVQVALSAPDVEIMRTLATLIYENVV